VESTNGNGWKQMTLRLTKHFFVCLYLILGTCPLGAVSDVSGSGAIEKLRIFVSVLPLKTFVEKVGGKQVQVQAMVQPGYSPHTYDPTPKQIAALSEALLYVRSGVPFEQVWMERIQAANPGMQVLDARTGIDLGAIDLHEHSDGHTGSVASSDKDDERRKATESDPHIWTSPRLVKQMAGRICDKLIELDPRNAQDYRRNYEAFAVELDTLDRDIRALLDDLPNRRFMVFHPAWGYFARDYGLIQVPIEHEGKEPGPRALTALIEQAKREQVKVIFVQPQYNSKSAAEVAREIGGRILAIDPLSADYSGNLRRIAQEIAAAARK
jgi:zinc transport system substrate-binding protein